MGNNYMNFEILETFGTLNDAQNDYQKKLTLVLWSPGGIPKYDLRVWNAKRPLKGITLSDTELLQLRDILDGLDLDLGETKNE